MIEVFGAGPARREKGERQYVASNAEEAFVYFTWRGEEPKGDVAGFAPRRSESVRLSELGHLDGVD
jgi:hypothetical protein